MDNRALLPDGNKWPGPLTRMAWRQPCPFRTVRGMADTATTADLTITLHDPRRFTESELAERLEFNRVLRREVLPDDPDETLEQAMAMAKATPERLRVWIFHARDRTGRLVGAARTAVDPEVQENRDLLQVNLAVLPEARRCGVGRRLLSELLAVAEEEGRTRLVGAAVAGRTGAREFAEALGAAVKQDVHLNHLPTAEVDRPMLEQWVEEAATRSKEYELLGWDGPVPEEHLARWVDLLPVMNTAPHDDLEVEDERVTPQQVREAEAVRAAGGIEYWALVARHRATGEWAGYHDVAWDPDQPAFVYVGATGVWPAHRGHALGKWLKAAMTLRVLDERPAVTSIRTGNADSNDAMLGINRAMGYRPLLAQQVWEVQVDQARDRLSSWESAG